MNIKFYNEFFTIATCNYITNLITVHPLKGSTNTLFLLIMNNHCSIAIKHANTN